MIPNAKILPKQFLVILRGAPASGKTTLAQRLRDFDRKIVWLKVDNFKPFFADQALLIHQKEVDLAALAVLRHLLDRGFSVVMEKIFYDPFVIPLAVKEAEKRKIKVVVFQIKCSLSALQTRDKVRPGVKEGCRKPMGGRAIAKIYRQLADTFYPGVVALDTENQSVEECLSVINARLNI